MKVPSKGKYWCYFLLTSTHLLGCLYEESWALLEKHDGSNARGEMQLGSRCGLDQVAGGQVNGGYSREPVGPSSFHQGHAPGLLLWNRDTEQMPPVIAGNQEKGAKEQVLL